MKEIGSEDERVFQTAAWMWLVYLGLQFCIDMAIYVGRFGGPVLFYYAVNFIPALAFYILAYSKWLTDRIKRPGVLLIGLISFFPILVNPFFDLKLPEAPLANIEGMVLRQLPVLMIGLVLVAWHYPIRFLVMYTLSLSICELAFVLMVKHFADPRLLAFIFTIIIRTVCFLVVGIFINQLITSLRIKQASLKKANQKLAHYASTLENLTISRERNRMSRELHDTVIHTLSGLSVQLETARAYLDVDKKTTGELLDRSLESTRNGLAETRRALKSMRATPLEDLGLIQSVRQLANNAAERAGIHLDLMLPQLLVLSPEVEQCVYRIAQEALENVVHHANAHSLVVNLIVTGRDLQLFIQDDGSGFDPVAGSPGGHYGITGMKERAQLVGGIFYIQSKRGSGTTIRLEIKDGIDESADM